MYVLYVINCKMLFEYGSMFIIFFFELRKALYNYFKCKINMNRDKLVKTRQRLKENNAVNFRWFPALWEAKVTLNFQNRYAYYFWGCNLGIRSIWIPKWKAVIKLHPSTNEQWESTSSKAINFMDNVNHTRDWRTI